MIFVTLGSQKFQFNRLLIEIDKLIEEGHIKENVFAQIGYSDYLPKNYQYKKFLDRDEFSSVMSKCDIIITHGGTGAIIGAVKQCKKVIAISRLAKYEEHVDNHQLQIIKEFEDMNFIKGVKEVGKLGNALNEIKYKSFSRYISNTDIIINDIEEFISNMKEEK